MDHPRSKLPAVLAVLFCIALLGGVGVLLWKTLPEKQQPQQAETIQTDSVFSSEQTAVEPEREAPYEGELPEQAEAAQPEQPDSEQPSEPAADPAAPDDTPVTDAQKTAQATLASMTEDEKLWQLFFVTPEAITNVNTATVAGEATKNALAQYPVGGIVYFAKNLEDRAQAAALLANTQSYAKIPLFLGIDQVKFRRKILPGETLEICARLTHERMEKAIATCAAEVFAGGELAASGEVTLAMR